MKEKIYFIPGLMTNEKLWSRVLPFLEDIFEIIYIKIPNSKDFDEKKNNIKKTICKLMICINLPIVFVFNKFIYSLISHLIL